MEKVMSRPASGDDRILMDARQAIASAQVVEQLRQARAPDKRHPQSDPLAQEEWKKTHRSARRNQAKLGTR